MHWWEWTDPAFTLSAVSAAVGFAVPILLYRLGVAASRRDAALTEQIAALTERMRATQEAQRASELREALKVSDDAKEFATLKAEITQLDVNFGPSLRRACRGNPLEPLPTRPTDLSDEARSDFIRSLPRRYSTPAFQPLVSLPEFVECVTAQRNQDADRDLSIALLDTALRRRDPGYLLFSAVTRASWRQGLDLLASLREHGAGTAYGLEVLLGVLESLRDMLEDRSERGLPSADRAGEIMMTLATLIHHRKLDDLASWTTRGEPGSAQTYPARRSDVTSALLAVISYTAHDHDHATMRALEGLPNVITGAGTLSAEYAAGLSVAPSRQESLDRIATSCPMLWESLGTHLVAACRGTRENPPR